MAQGVLDLQADNLDLIPRVHMKVGETRTQLRSLLHIYAMPRPGLTLQAYIHSGK